MALSDEFRAFRRRRAEGAAARVLREPTASDPYVGGGHGAATEIAPAPEANRRLPRVEDRWELLDDLLVAIQLIASREGAPEAVARLARHEAVREKNPALLFWTARANQWAGRMEKLAPDTRRIYLERAERLFARHHELFGHPRSFDSGLKALLDLHELTGEVERLRSLVKRATGEINAGAGRKMTHVFRGLARERLGNLEGAREDFESARALDPDDPQVRADLARLEEGG